jgi:hypothetical protein
MEFVTTNTRWNNVLTRMVRKQIEDEHFAELVKRVALCGGAVRSGYRRWYNPLRYFKGIYYIKYISPKRIWK